MGMLADQVDHVIGVDAHRDAHSAAAVAAATGAIAAQSAFAANPIGYKRALRFARQHAREAEAKTPGEIKRCPKRYVARRLFRILEDTGPTPTPTSLVAERGPSAPALDRHRSLRECALAQPVGGRDKAAGRARRWRP